MCVRLRACRVTHHARVVCVRVCQMSPELMTTRLGDLDREWTIHRLVALVVGLVSAGGLLGGWWYGHHSCYLIALVSSLVLLQHAITGWSPLVPPLRLLVLHLHLHACQA